MKLSLKKREISAFRLLGHNKSILSLNNAIGPTANLYSIIHQMNNIQLIEDKIYFKIVEPNIMIGPFVQVIGNTNPTPDDFLTIDYKNTFLYRMDLGKIEVSSVPAMNLVTDAIKSISEIKKEINFVDAYISLEMDKIELQLFEK